MEIFKRYFLQIISSILCCLLGLAMMGAMKHKTIAETRKIQGPLSEYSKTVRILTIDGGGARGIIPLYVLQYLEKKTGKPIADLFDVFAGTSTGGIIVAGLTKPANGRLSAHELLNIYNQSLPKIFHRTLWYRIKTADGFLAPSYNSYYRDEMVDTFAQNVKLSQLVKNVILCSYSLSEQSPKFFTNWDAQKSAENDYFISDLVKGGSSPLTIFPPYNVYNVPKTKLDVLVDAATYLSNPVLQTYIKVRHFYPHRKIVIVSLGTGDMKFILPKKHDITHDNWGIIQSSQILIISSMHASSQIASRAVLDLYQTPTSPEIAYFRFDTNINNEDYNPFASDTKTIDKLNEYGQNLVEKHKKQLDEVAAILLKNS